MIRSQPQAWTQIFGDLRSLSKECAPRGQKILEIEDYQIEFDHTNTFCPFSERDLSLKYLAGELAWYMRADRNDRSIEYYSKFWKGIASEIPPRWNSNYGHYFFGMGQLLSVVRALTQDPDSRQACVVLNSADIAFSNSKDKVCTNAVMFRIRENKLNMTVQMRSNDAILGLGYDAPIFSIIQEMVLGALRNVYPSLNMGKYTHNAASFHIYEKHWKLLETPGMLVNVELPEMRFQDYVDVRYKFPIFEEQFRTQGLLNSSDSPFIQTLLKWLIYDR